MAGEAQGMEGQGWRRWLWASAERARVQREKDRTAPEAAQARRGEALERARQEHERQQLEQQDAFLARQGVGDEELDVLRAGVSPTWGLIVGADGRRFSAVSEARAWWDSGETFLALLGTTGTGKSVAAAELCARCRFGYEHPDFGATWCWPSTVSEQPRFVQAPELARRSAYGADVLKEDARLARYRLLVIDELGAEVMTDAWGAVLQQLIQARYRAQRRTVLLGNLTPEKLWARYDRRVQRRVEEAGRIANLGGVRLSMREVAR